ncbi:tRNA modification GTPase GTPBP3, mitochondrial [Golovinomyces cichoracearum]|uniref:tRNA modification GTPase GTPBP3, mitochondrial n=1 Tax=Golovinomyces cichoracearum TaxID=62708 RepID=A0A420J588_9PEZI|nr:tRNA modification GTPase GTPBP3, mitochondrial [Golovinomyces cichoracearum]
MQNPNTSVTCGDTIYALSTAPGRGALAIVYKKLCPNSPLPKPRKASVRKLLDPSDRNIVIDSAAVIIHYSAPKSATGEDILELHIHGGPATQRAVLAAVSKVSSDKSLFLRFAEPGEFTKKAFINHRLEITQVEALSDELSAETEQQRRAAVRGNHKKLSITYDRWREKLLHARAQIEALIDFSEDQNFEQSPQVLLQSITDQVNLILKETERFKSASNYGELLKKGIKISLLGPPNSGKSSLLNRITGREASIVCEEAGTTRDIIEVNLDINGYLCTFADTAGLRDESTVNDIQAAKIGVVEQEGIKRAKIKANKSDLVIALASIERDKSLERWLINYNVNSLSLAANASKALIVLNKCDLIASSDQIDLILHEFESKVAAAFSPRIPPSITMISCHNDSIELDLNGNNGNIELLISKLTQTIKEITNFPVDVGDLIGVTERQRLIIDSFCAYLDQFKNETDILLAAEKLRLAANCLARITGRGGVGDVEELLGVIFEKYSISFQPLKSNR